MKPKVSVVIPTYNEKERVAKNYVIKSRDVPF